jgi:hypothetical protein
MRVCNNYKKVSKNVCICQGSMLPQSSINIDDCSPSVLTLYYGNLDCECTAELLENPLEHILDDIDSGLEKIMYI